MLSYQSFTNPHYLLKVYIWIISFTKCITWRNNISSNYDLVIRWREPEREWTAERWVNVGKPNLTPKVSHRNKISCGRRCNLHWPKCTVSFSEFNPDCKPVRVSSRVDLESNISCTIVAWNPTDIYNIIKTIASKVDHILLRRHLKLLKSKQNNVT